MNRSITIIFAFILSFLVSLAACCEDNPVVFETRALWAPESDIDSPADIDRLIDRMSSANMNVLLPCVYCHGFVYFRNRFIEMNPSLPAGFDPLAYMLEKAHAAGIEVHPWFCVSYIGTRSAEGANRGTVITGHPEFGALARGGADYEMPDPGMIHGNFHSKSFRDFSVGLMSEMVRDYAVDGLHFDYIRAGANSFDEDSDKEFRAQFGRPIDEARPGDWPLWNSPHVNDIVKRTSEAARLFRPGVIISAAVFENVNFILQQGQDSAKWANEGWTDVNFTMNYDMNTQVVRFYEKDYSLRVKEPSHGVGLSFYQRDAERKVSPRPAKLVLEQIRLVRSMKLRHLAFFASPYLSDEILDALIGGPFRTKAIPRYRRGE